MNNRTYKELILHERVKEYKLSGVRDWSLMHKLSSSGQSNPFRLRTCIQEMISRVQKTKIKSKSVIWLKQEIILNTEQGNHTCHQVQS